MHKDGSRIAGRRELAGISGPSSLPVGPHEYHEISDEENGACGGLFYPSGSNHALESPAFEVSM